MIFRTDQGSHSFCSRGSKGRERSGKVLLHPTLISPGMDSSRPISVLLSYRSTTFQKPWTGLHARGSSCRRDHWSGPSLNFNVGSLRRISATCSPPIEAVWMILIYFLDFFFFYHPKCEKKKNQALRFALMAPSGGRSRRSLTRHGW